MRRCTRPCKDPRSDRAARTSRFKSHLSIRFRLQTGISFRRSHTDLRSHGEREGCRFLRRVSALATLRYPRDPLQEFRHGGVRQGSFGRIFAGAIPRDHIFLFRVQNTRLSKSTVELMYRM
ncbi:hypothetical protein PUN28_003866 [Cardiocondyla obscurior]|uniref:Uncharacterized protein n=1 Tax=Cardiocondyla obscurior TaxID=286306 RepID=A0AAW2GN02_9HYME